jgi:hemerythrin-like domain-containing protein
MNIQVASDIIATKVDDETALLNIRTGKYYALNAVGGRIWELVAEHGETEKILRVLLEEFNAPEAVLRGDMEALMKKLEAADLIAVS